MSETKKLTEEELTEIKQIKTEYTNLIMALGEVELQKSDIYKQKANLLNIQNQLIERENKLAKELTEKYGNGSINLDTGEINL
jgi:hypothetical protein